MDGGIVSARGWFCADGMLSLHLTAPFACDDLGPNAALIAELATLTCVLQQDKWLHMTCRCTGKC